VSGVAGSLPGSLPGNLPGNLPILRFRAAEVSLAIAAEAASGFGPPSRGVPHIGELLGLDVAAEKPGRRVLRLEDNGAVAQVIVDGPVVLQTIGPADVVPPPPTGPLRQSPVVLGYAAAQSLERELVVLLDVERLIALAGERARGDGSSARP
jgi:hypothetical protein